ncbi:hypothetical protein [Saccharopolyspora spinosa]|uniref:hypothetical protein n=1 Tax=Saccharopolyspora spinosa TaxID=60894 RepID=UPI00117A4652|nr:hypothetical protein [Saccharopolyspora spinosa]
MPAPPWRWAAAIRPDNAWWLVLSDQDAVGPIVCQYQVGPLAGDDRAVTESAGRFHHYLADVLPGFAHAAQAGGTTQPK